MDKVKQGLYYVIIAVVSVLCLVFLPMIGSEVGMNWDLPTTPVGWIIWVVVKLIVAAINVLLFHCFMEQAKLNVKDNPNYKRANEMLYKIAPKVYKPRSPKEWNKKEYSVKGVSIFVTTMLSAVALTQAILSFDYMSMLTYLFTIIMGIIFGIVQMKKAEVYWTQEYYDFAVNFVEKHGGLENDNNKQQGVQESTGTSTQE